MVKSLKFRSKREQRAAFAQMGNRGFAGTSPAKPKGSWIGFVKAHKNIRTPKGLLDLKKISKLYKKSM